MKLLLQFMSGLPLMAAGMAIGVAAPDTPMVDEGTAGGVRYIEEGQPPVIIHATVEDAQRARAAAAAEAAAHANSNSGLGAGTTSNLSYHGGTGGVGVETAPKIYLVLWGSQWNNNDPSGEAAILQSFYSGAGGSPWLNSVIQYCQGVASGTVFCNGSGTAAGNQANIFAGIWADNAKAAPSRPKQSQIAAEAVNAAKHFGNTAAGSNASVQYVIATATGNSSTGFKTQYCAYHSSTSSTYGNV